MSLTNQKNKKSTRSMPGVFYCLRNASNPWGNQNAGTSDIKLQVFPTWGEIQKSSQNQITGIPMHLGDTEVAKVTACSAVDDALYAGTRTTVRPAKRAGIYCLPYYVSCFIGMFFHIIYITYIHIISLFYFQRLLPYIKREIYRPLCLPDFLEA